MAARVAALGLVELRPGVVAYARPYAPPVVPLRSLIMVPHGRTPSNVRLLFQSHAEGPNATLLPESLDDAAAGADAFLDAHGARLAAAPERFAFARSPLRRCAQTAEAYAARFAARGFPPLDVAVDGRLLEIDHASWHGSTVDEVPAGPERAAAERYRAGDFYAKPSDGESNVDVLERARAWLEDPPAARDQHLVVFGHGTFQNAAEVVLRCLGDREPADVFSRAPGRSHLRRGFPHALYPT